MVRVVRPRSTQSSPDGSITQARIIMVDTKTDSSSIPLSDDRANPTKGLSAKRSTASHPAGAEPGLDTLFHRTSLRCKLRDGPCRSSNTVLTRPNDGERQRSGPRASQTSESHRTPATSRRERPRPTRNRSRIWIPSARIPPTTSAGSTPFRRRARTRHRCGVGRAVLPAMTGRSDPRGSVRWSRARSLGP